MTFADVPGSLPPRPQLRGHLCRFTDPDDPRFGLVVDELRQCPMPLRLPRQEYQWLRWFDGQHGLADIQQAARRYHGGEMLPLERLQHLTATLDDALLLEGPRWQQRIAAPVREPACIGCYDGDAEVLARDIQDLFTMPGGPGLPSSPRRDNPLRAALIPHIDYARGGVTYAHGFKEVFEQADASLFVIIGTSHHSTRRFTLTRKHFKTPLGTVPTDGDFIDRIVGHYGDGLFDHELLAHLPEHSIELEVVLLQWYYAKRRPIRIVPLVVGSFHDATLAGQNPAALDDVARMIEALRQAEASTPEPVFFIISGDLAHIGPKFDPGRPSLDGPELSDSHRQDKALLKRLQQADLAEFFKIVADEQDARSICGFPPAFTTLSAVQPAHGKLLHHGRYIHPRGHESVSFASMGFYR